MRGWAAIGAGMGAGLGMVAAAMVGPRHIQGMTRQETELYSEVLGAMLGGAAGAFIGAGSPPKQISVTGVGELRSEWKL